ncbi:hypothetical protein LJC11_05700 [Bacteroidales bacterium OttesenSCG-928-I21]|nr:hypothetical protein [Bacteroidales bacterium OttesenSCG-928-I21]
MKNQNQSASHAPAITTRHGRVNKKMAATFLRQLANQISKSEEIYFGNSEISAYDVVLNLSSPSGTISLICQDLKGGVL